MRFSADEMKGQLAAVHPDLLLALKEFEMWSHRANLPEPHICEVHRTRAEQGRIYFGLWRDQAKKVLSNPKAGTVERTHAQKLLAMPERELLARAEKKFSWHLVSAAADVRTNHYSREQLGQVVRWFEARCKAPIWELVHEPHGTGPHIHVGRRDYSWRKKMEETPNA